MGIHAVVPNFALFAAKTENSSRRSEIDAELGTEHQRVFQMAGPNDVLEIGQDEEGTPAEIEAMGPFRDRLVILHARCGTQAVVHFAMQVVANR